MNTYTIRLNRLNWEYPRLTVNIQGVFYQCQCLQSCKYTQEKRSLNQIIVSHTSVNGTRVEPSRAGRSLRGVIPHCCSFNRRVTANS